MVFFPQLAKPQCHCCCSVSCSDTENLDIVSQGHTESLSGSITTLGDTLRCFTGIPDTLTGNM